MNDGKADALLYKQPEFQLADRYSLETDTSTYFLTVNAGGGNLRYTNTVNTAPSAATPDAYFMRNINLFYKDNLNRGFAKDLGEYVYSSAYDNGEGYTTSDRNISSPFTETINGLNVYTSGPANSLSVRAKVFSNTDNIQRTINLNIFGTNLSSIVTNNTTQAVFDVTNQPLSYLQNPSSASISITNSNISNSTINDRFVIAQVGLTYPSIFNFNNNKSFAFELVAAASNYLVIDNFNFGTTAPILYDVNNGKRYIGEIISTTGKVKFVLPSSSDPVRKFILNNGEASNIINVNTLITKNFINYNTAATRGDYVIISNPLLYNDGGVNNVELYRAYRSTANGGGFNAKVYDINELTDQFGFGIKSHPDAIRNFVRFMDVQYSIKPKYIFIIGRGITYQGKRPQESNPIAAQLDLVGTFGWPASDNLLVSQPGTTTPITPVGRLGAITGAEVGIYFQKVLQYEQVQRTQSPAIADKQWMKNFIHIVGGKTTGEALQLGSYMDQNKVIVEDTLYGGKVETFRKTSVATIQQASSQRITELFEEGIGFLGYFGHSSASTFEFNISSPENYNNTGKYPFFNVSGCIAGDFYSYDPSRLTTLATLSEKYTFANQKGSIGFLADTHFGIPFALNNYNNRFYRNFSLLMYGKTVGEQLKDVHVFLNGGNPALDYYTRIHLEEINLNGDPAIKINAFPKADYVIEEQSVVISPTIITVADPFFNVKVDMRNIGKAVGDSIRVSVKRLLPNTTIPVTIKDTLIPGIRFADSLNINVPINPSTDNGLNKIIVELDWTNKVSEIYETNNKITKDVFIFENTLNPVFPYNFSIVNIQNITFSASTANPLIGLSNYTMELDTTELFNSAFKKTYTQSSLGGVIQFTPTNLTFADSTVYYWRTAVVPATGTTIWNNASFVYLPASSPGFNQSHYYQFLKSNAAELVLDNDRIWKYKSYNSVVKIYNGVFPTAANQAQDFMVDIDGSDNIQSVCGISNIIINAISPSEMEPILNANTGSSQYGSDNVCGPTRKYNFQFNILSQAKRDSARVFLDLIPAGYYVVVRNTSGTAFNSNTYAADWQADGVNSMYSRLKNAGFADIDSFNRPRAFNFIYRKGISSFIPVSKFSDGINDKIEMVVNCLAFKAKGVITSPVVGPAKNWGFFRWRGKSLETPTSDSVKFDIIGISSLGAETVLFTVDSTMQNFDISSINASTYPFLKLKMYNVDRAASTPYQLRYLRLNYSPVPEGAVAPNIKFTMEDEHNEKLAFLDVLINRDNINNKYRWL